MEKGRGDNMFFNKTPRDWKVKEREKEIRANKKYERRLVIEKRKSKERKRKNELRQIRMKNSYISERLRKCTTSKILMYIILLNCSVVEIYSMWIMYYLRDLSALYSLIGAVIGESISYAIYSAKSFNETKEESKINLEREKLLLNSENPKQENQVTDDNDKPEMDDEMNIKSEG